MPSFSRVAAVTGANKGIGLAIVRNLALQYPKSAFNNGPLLIYLTAREKARGEAALEIIHDDAQLKKAKALAQDGGLATVRFRQLDISDRGSIQDFAGFQRSEHPEGIDVVVNNAGIAMDGFGMLSLDLSDWRGRKQTLKWLIHRHQTSTSSKPPSTATTTAPSLQPSFSSPSSAPVAASSMSPVRWGI